MLRTPSRALRCAVGGLKIAIATTVTVLAIGPGLTAAQDAGTGGTAEASEAAWTLLQAEYDALAAAHGCSVTGFGADVVPGSALVQRADGVVRVSFDEGWAVHHGQASGSLLAICRDAL